MIGKALYVSDNRADQLFRVEPADFLKSKAAPKITVVFKGKGVFPNGLYPGRDGALLMVGFESKDKPHGIYSMAPGKDPTQLSENIGMLDGLYRLGEGDVLATDWVSGSLFRWNKKDGMQKLATGFKGPADLCALSNKKGLLDGRARSWSRAIALRSVRQMIARHAVRSHHFTFRRKVKGHEPSSNVSG